MFRILGFIIGSVTSVFIILMLIGMPTFHLSDPAADQQRYDAAIEKLKAKQFEIETVTGQLSKDMQRVTESVSTGLNQADGNSPATSNDVPLNPADNSAYPPAAEIATAAETAPGVADDPLWYSFWTPFRSEIAARGFVAQLEKVTGLDYRIVKVETGVFEVAFAYNDDSERRSKLAVISSATGLDLPDS
jgi:hypothetical protein